MITYTGGTTSKDKIVPITKPPNTTVPMDCWALAPALWAITKGKKTSEGGDGGHQNRLQPFSSCLCSGLDNLGTLSD